MVSKKKKVFEPIITSLLDQDLYKLSMQMAVLHQFPANVVKYEFTNRSNLVNIGHLKSEIDEQIEHFCKLSFTPDELDYLRTIPFLKKDFIDMLSFYKPRQEFIKTRVKESGDLAIEIEGSWWQTILFEVPVLAIIEEVYMKSLINRDVMLDESLDNLSKFFDRLDIENTKMAGTNRKIQFADFGTRRRWSRNYHRMVLNNITGHKVYKHLIVGTSNLYYAKKFDIKPIGTMAHEWFMGHQGLFRLVDHQKQALENWVKEYRGDLGIALTDTITSEAFLNDFDNYFGKLYDGLRHDSGSPYVFTDKVVEHYEKLGIDPKTKTIVFSDGLTFPDMIKIRNHVDGRINMSFGIGTNLTNAVPMFKPLSIVIKLTESNGKPVAKISDEPGKAMCNDVGYLKYLKSQFNIT